MPTIQNIIGPAAPSPVVDTSTPALGKQEFMRLLVMQLRNQDPLNPVEDREFITQMAQLSTLEATTALTNQVEQVVAAQMQTAALQMVGREVEYLNDEGVTARGKVSAVRLDSYPPRLVVNDQEVPVIFVQKVL